MFFKKASTLPILSLLLVPITLAAPPLFAASPIITVPHADTSITAVAGVPIVPLTLTATDADFGDVLNWSISTGTATNTTLSAGISAGATSATLVSVVGLQVGSFATFFNGINTEAKILTGVNTTTRVVTWVGGLVNAYSKWNGVVTYVQPGRGHGNAAIAGAPGVSPRSCTFTWTPAVTDANTIVPFTFNVSDGSVITTTLSVSVAALATSATLTTVSGLQPGRSISFFNGINTEVRDLIAVDAVYRTVTWAGGLVNAYTVANCVVTYNPVVSRTVTFVVKDQGLSTYPYNVITPKPIDPRRIGLNATDVRILAWTAQASGFADSLKQVTMTSFIERAYAGRQYSLWVWDATDRTYHLLKTVNTQSVKFETNDRLSFTDCLWFTQPTNPPSLDTFYIRMDANTAYIQGLAEVFDTTGVKIKVFDDDVDYSSDPDGAGALPAKTFTNLATLENAGVCISRPQGTVPCYEIEFDTKAPRCSLYVSQIYDNCRIGTLDLGDSIWIRFGPTGADTACFSHYNQAGMPFADSVFQSRNFPETVAVEWSHYMTRTGTGPLWIRLARPWSLRYMIPDSVVRVPIDTLEGLKVYAYIRDSADNYAIHHNTWPIRVDTKKPWIDSKSWSHFYNSNGKPPSGPPNDTISVGDSLSFTVVTTSTNSIPGEREVDSVNAHFYTCGFTEAAKDLQMFDVGNVIVNGNTIWTLKLETEAISCPRDVPYNRDSTGINGDFKSWVVFTLWDNGCNTYKDSIFVREAIDLNPPALNSWSYSTIFDRDQNGCTNLRDRVRVGVHLANGVYDVVRVHADYLDAGIGALLEQDLIEVVDTVWQRDTTLVENDPNYAKDDNPLMRIGDVGPIFPADADYSVQMTVVDDAGNTQKVSATLDNGFRQLDTRRPLSINKNSVHLSRLPNGSYNLKWPRSAQDIDAAWFYIFSDSGKGGGIYYPGSRDSAFGSTFDGESGIPDSNSWTSEPIPLGMRYKFSIRSLDDCGNFEFNTDIFRLPADSIILGCPVVGNLPYPDSIGIPLYISNEQPIAAFSLGFRYQSRNAHADSLIEITSWNPAGGVIPPAALPFCWTLSRPDSNQFLIGWVDFSLYTPIPPGKGLLGTLYMRLIGVTALDTIDIDSSFVGPAGEWILVADTSLSPGYQTGKLSPLYIDCGEDDIILGALCGDVDASGGINVSDPVYLIQYIFADGPEPKPFRLNGDADCGGSIDVADVVYLLNYIFGNGPQPCEGCN